MKTGIGIAVAVLIAIGGFGLWQAGVVPGPMLEWSPQGSTSSGGQNPPNSAEGAPEGSIHNLPLPKAVAAVRAHAAQKAGVAESKVLIETAFEKEWPDGCLGLGGDRFCTQAIVPGWEVTVRVNGELQVYRTNADGSVIARER